MPHYATKHEAKIGEIVLYTSKGSDYRLIGVVAAISASTSCNAQLLPMARQHSPQGPWYPASNPAYPECVTLADCVRMLPEEPAPDPKPQ